ncbi:BZ3500_MvSof-1268-A1-R1_Chr3-1g05803 [Microbotryum saponariae]|uniref:medium-chain acyl-CoA ligase n=1 Tax=Microbotryum saponariae TaxID=289078 RepID=A0A2X0LZM0_9BASI|nr:BZ3500_MvSof-1268-A1-R1_Chr3-1g05803 [Microbotryum saponariae]SDA04993.1 BZ3501_MvSof-1269-A2-R1_Chr3-1g05473 [Microbotryum saponariae]
MAALPNDFSLAALESAYGQGIPCPSDFSFPSHVLDRWTSKQPQAPAIIWASPDFKQERIVSYKELSDLSNRAALAFEKHGIKKGDKVMVQLPRVAEWWIVIFGLMRLGAVPAPGTSLLVAKDLKFRATSCKATAFVGDTEACSRFQDISSEVGVSLVFQVRTQDDGDLGRSRIDFQDAVSKVPKEAKCDHVQHASNDLALLYFTSGTTGDSKMVLLENEYTLGHTITGAWYHLAPGKVFANMADLGWAKAAYSTFGCFNHGATLFVQPPPPGAFHPSSVIDILHRYPITSLCAPPTIYRTLVTSAALEYLASHPVKALDHCCSAGEPLNASVIKEWRDKTGITIKDAWGQTETVIMVGNFAGEKVKEGSMGKCAPHFVVGIIGPNGEELEDGQEGELAVRTDVGGGAKWIFKGYIKKGKIDKREKKFGGKTWYCTGDRGVRDTDKYFHFVGRDDDVITSSGYRIGPFEVESALKAHPAVLESAAVGSPDEARGEIVKAFVILSAEYAHRGKSEGPDRDALVLELQDFFKKQTGPYKVPREIEFVEDLPKTVSGKIRRIELRQAEYKKKAHIVAKQKAKL